MKKIVVLFACIFAVPLLMGAHYNINGINTQVMATSQTIAGSGTFTSSACTLMGKCENLSIQYQLVSGTTPDVTFKITTSLDETNFATPDTGGTVKANLTEISAGNGYTAGGSTITISASSQSSGTYKLVVADVTITASGGAIGPFRYAVVYNDTAATDELICWHDYGSSISLNSGETFTWDADATNGLLQLA